MQDESRWQNVLACAGQRVLHMGQVGEVWSWVEFKSIERLVKQSGTAAQRREEVEASCGKHRQELELLWIFTAPSVNFQK